MQGNFTPRLSRTGVTPFPRLRSITVPISDFDEDETVEYQWSENVTSGDQSYETTVRESVVETTVSGDTESRHQVLHGFGVVSAAREVSMDTNLQFDAQLRYIISNEATITLRVGAQEFSASNEFNPVNQEFERGTDVEAIASVERRDIARPASGVAVFESLENSIDDIDIDIDL